MRDPYKRVAHPPPAAPVPGFFPTERKRPLSYRNQSAVTPAAAAAGWRADLPLVAPDKPRADQKGLEPTADWALIPGRGRRKGHLPIT